MSTYLIFNQLRIIHPQFRPKSRSSVLEPSQNFLSSLIWSYVRSISFLARLRIRGTKQRRDYMSKRPPQNVAQEGNYNTIELYSKVPQNSSNMALSHILILPCCHSKCSYIVPVDPHMQQPPRGGTWVGITCDIVKSMSELYLKSVTKLYILKSITILYI
ncbi:neurotrimin-like isoform X2 [Vespula maculifrons]|uniref:Neurotrimin-like isoform X2 n=1 Tax=Vespula maculifrons TaxID=7453 RepID=A0ABD2C897_VESMC